MLFICPHILHIHFSPPSINFTNGFKYARIDFYDVKGKPYFGEITLSPAGGNLYYFNDETEFKKLSTQSSIISKILSYQGFATSNKRKSMSTHFL